MKIPAPGPGLKLPCRAIANTLRLGSVLALAALLCAPAAQALKLQKLPPPGSRADAPTVDMSLKLKWSDLLPEGERDRGTTLPLPPMHNFLDESGPAPERSMSFAVNKDLEGLTVTLSGFVVPIGMDDQGRILDFFLVPYFGACIHLPPPPPNQIAYVIPPKPFKLANLYLPYSVTGKLATGSNSNRLGASAYTLTGTAMETYAGE